MEQLNRPVCASNIDTDQRQRHRPNDQLLILRCMDMFRSIDEKRKAGTEYRHAQKLEQDTSNDKVRPRFRRLIRIGFRRSKSTSSCLDEQRHDITRTENPEISLWLEERKVRSSSNDESGKNQIDCCGEKDGRNDECGDLCQERRLVVWAFRVPCPACPAYTFHQRSDEEAVACPASVLECSEELHAECSSK